MSGVVTWRETEQGLKPFLVQGRKSTHIHWAPQPGSQQAFMECPVFEVLYHGNRGGGKTDALLMDFAQHVGRGFGPDWRGILFRQTYPQLKDAIDKSRKWFSVIFPEAKYNRSEHEWVWPTGEVLLFRHMDDPNDYWGYHGHSYTWLGWEELTNWPTSECYLRMMSCVRKTRKDIPLKVRATCNPYGAGHSWVKFRWRLPDPPRKMIGKVITDSLGGDGSIEPPRVAIRSRLEENLVLLTSDPNYITRILAAATNDAQREAWKNGSWDIVAGGMFSDVWDPRCHVIPSFPIIQVQLMPPGWYIDRSYDHGQSKPFSVGWWAESNGEPWQVNDRIYGSVRGDLIRFAEWYGWNGQPNTGIRMSSKRIAEGILERETKWGIKGLVRPGPADSSIFDDYEPGSSVAGLMQSKGVTWQRADKRAGSRKQGWQKIRELLEGAMPVPDGYREEPGLFVTENCDQFRRTVPVLARLERDLDDIDTRTEDHIADEVRYRVRAKNLQIQVGSWK